MHLILAALLLIALPIATPAANDLPLAQNLLRACIDALPDIPLIVTGDLQSRSRAGDLEQKKLVEMTLDWRAAPPTARYTIRDAFGHNPEHLSITWPIGAPVEYRFFNGDPLQAAPLPDLSAPIAGTDISWQDLSLSFLWWPNAKTIGEDSVRDRNCYIVDLPASNLAMRLWIDPKIPVMLRAETWSGETLLRRMDVKGFKKINGRWVIQNIEVESFPARHKTTLTVRDVQDRERKSYIRPDEGGPEEIREPVDTLAPVPVE